MFEDADKQFDLVFSALKMGRSLAASYNLQSDIQCKLFSPADFSQSFSFLFFRQSLSRCSLTQRLRCSNRSFRPLSHSPKVARVQKSCVIRKRFLRGVEVAHSPQPSLSTHLCACVY